MTFKFIKEHKKLIYFVFSFYLAMKISSYTQILYFQSNHQLNLFSLYYSVMAIAGAFSFLISNQLVSYPISVLHKIFVVIYSFALILRIFVNSPLLVILSAILSGVSASIVLMLLRRWIYVTTDKNKEERGKIHSIRFFFMQLAVITSSAIAGILFGGLTHFFTSNKSYIIILLFSGILMLTNLMVKLPDILDGEKKDSKFYFFPKKNKKLSIIMYIMYIFLGISVAIVTSILPAIIHGSGWSVENSSFIVSGLAIFTLLFSYFYQQKWITDHANIVFLTSQLFSVLVCCLSLFLFQEKITVILIGLVTEATLAGFFILKELLEYEIIPVKQRQVFFGLLQSSFLIGDSLASPIGSFLYLTRGLPGLITIYSLIVTGSSFAFYLLLKNSKIQDNIIAK